MNKKLIGLLTGLILYGLSISSAQAAFIYNLNATATDGLPNFVLTVDSLISSTTTFALTDFDSINLPGSTGVTSVEFGNPLGSPFIHFLQTDSYFGFFWTPDNAFTGPGTYCAGAISCAETAAILTIREQVPEPTSIALLGLGLAGFVFARKRGVASSRSATAIQPGSAGRVKSLHRL